jgi:hypothetical protein
MSLVRHVDLLQKRGAAVLLEPAEQQLHNDEDDALNE